MNNYDTSCIIRYVCVESWDIINIQTIKDAIKHHQSKCENYIIGRHKYINTAVLMPLVAIEGIWHLLFQERSPHIRQGGEISFPGGKHDPSDRTYEDTAIRETIEELGISKQQIEMIGHMGCLVTSMGVCVETYVGVLDVADIQAIPINKAEVTRVFAIPISFFMENQPDSYYVRLEVQPHYIDSKNNKEVFLPSKELGLPERYHQSWGGSMRKIYVHHTDHGIIWGITAELIVELMKLIYGDVGDIGGNNDKNRTR